MVSAPDAWKIISCLAKQGGRFRLRKSKALGAAFLSPTLEKDGSRGGWIQCPCAFSCRYWPSSFGDKCSPSLRQSAGRADGRGRGGTESSMVAAVGVLGRQQRSAVGAVLENRGAAAPVGADSD